jgi:hypothetical protein
MKKLFLGILVLVLGLAYSVNSNAGEKLDLIFCTSDMTKYQDRRYSDVFLKNEFGGSCPRSKPFEITYKQISEKVSSNYRICYDTKKTKGHRVLYTPKPCNIVYENGGGIPVKYDGKQFYIGERATESNTASFKTPIGAHSSTCKEIGFTPGTEKFGDCVLKLVELDIKRGGNVQAAKQFQRKRQDKASEMLIQLGLGLLSQSTTTQTQTQTNRNQWSTCRWQSGGLGQPYMTCRAW